MIFADAIRWRIGYLLERAINCIEPRLPRPRIIADQAGTSKYLSRYYLTGRPTMPDGSEPFDAGQARPGAVWPKSPFSIYLHHIHRGDEDRQLHNHPWAWSFSLILSGGYLEERRIKNGVVRRTLAPLVIHWIGHDTFHRIDTLGKSGAWTLFVVGPKVSGWGFWDRATGELTEWRAFLDRKRGEGWQSP
jgi:hypothetical protein